MGNIIDMRPLASGSSGRGGLANLNGGLDDDRFGSTPRQLYVQRCPRQYPRRVSTGALFLFGLPLLSHHAYTRAESANSTAGASYAYGSLMATEWICEQSETP